LELVAQKPATEKTPLKIFYHINNPHDNSAERWIYEVWKDGFNSIGHKVIPVNDQNLISILTPETESLFMTDICVIKLSKFNKFLQQKRRQKLKVAAWIHWPLIKDVYFNKKYFFDEGFADLYFGERENDGEQFYLETGKQYYCIPHAASANIQKAGTVEDNKQYDVVYLGSKLPKKAWFERNILGHLKKDKNIKTKIIGTGWSKRDILVKAFRKAFKKLHFYKLKNVFDKMTVKISIEDEARLYQLAKIALNFHEREPDGSQPHYIVNSRTFKIPACGGFQICDEVPAIRKYFTEDELVMCSLNRKNWLETIYYFLENESERKKIQQKGTQRAQRDHLSSVRGLQILQLIKR
jgi:hypothetical protein